MMNNIETEKRPNRYARAIQASKKVRWDIDADVIRGRRFDFTMRFLPDELSFVNELANFLTEDEQRFLSQIQGRTYANMFGLVERFVCAKAVELEQRHALGDQVALEALVRFGDEELKHQELFRRIEILAGEKMPGGYVFGLDATGVAQAVLSKPSWSVLALVFLIELFSQAHYKESLEPGGARICDLFRDVFRFHWLEQSQHAILDELEWLAEDARITASERDVAVTGLIELVGAVDGLVQQQSAADASYFLARIPRSLSEDEMDAVRATVLKAYRWQYIFSGVEKTRFVAVLRGVIDEHQFARIAAALSTLR